MAKWLALMSTPLTRATTVSEADPLDEGEEDDDEDEDESCEQPATIGSTSSTSAAIAETAARPWVRGFDGIMAQSLQIIRGPADRGMRPDSRAIANPLQWLPRGKNLKRP
jgi:hypothetical protein